MLGGPKAEAAGAAFWVGGIEGEGPEAALVAPWALHVLLGAGGQDGLVGRAAQPDPLCLVSPQPRAASPDSVREAPGPRWPLTLQWHWPVRGSHRLGTEPASWQSQGRQLGKPWKPGAQASQRRPVTLGLHLPEGVQRLAASPPPDLSHCTETAGGPTRWQTPKACPSPTRPERVPSVAMPPNPGPARGHGDSPAAQLTCTGHCPHHRWGQRAPGPRALSSHTPHSPPGGGNRRSGAGRRRSQVGRCAAGKRIGL